MQNLKISIVTVVLNGEKTIEQTIQSVLAQGYDNLEYIIIDGGSTDNTIEIVNKYKEKITYFVSEPDNGIYDAMNKGIRQASGDIIGIINSDDWYEPGVFHKVSEAFQDAEIDLIYGKMNLVYENDRIEEQAENLLKNICFEMSVPHSTVFVRKDIYHKYGTFNLNYKIAADYDFLLKLYMNGVGFRKINKILANFRMTGISNTMNGLCTEETQSISNKYLSLETLKSVLANLAIAEKNKILVYGAGYWGQWLINNLVKIGITNIICVDKDDTKQGQEITDIQICNLDVLNNYEGTVLVGVYNSESIVKQLKSPTFKFKNVIEIKQIIENYKDKLYDRYLNYRGKNYN